MEWACLRAGGGGLIAGLGCLRHPVVALWVVFGTMLAYLLIGYPYGPVFLNLIVAFFATATTGHRRPAWTVTGLIFVSFTWLGWLAGGQPGPTLEGTLLLAASLAVLVVGAEVIRVRREHSIEVYSSGEHGRLHSCRYHGLRASAVAESWTTASTRARISSILSSSAASYA
jgi:hypothetical protein